MRGRHDYERKLLSVKAASKTKFNPKQWIMGGVIMIFSCTLVGYLSHLAIIGLMNQAFYRNHDFVIRHINIDVNGSISNAEVLKWSGLVLGQNLMAVDLSQVRDRLMQVSYISRASVERKLPDTICIEVDERQPIALLQPRPTRGYKLAQDVYYIDAQGVVMRPKPGEKLKSLPMITGVDSDAVSEGLPVERPEVLTAVTFIRLVEISPARHDLDLTSIDVQSRGLLVVHTEDQGSVRFRLDYLEQQLQRLQVIFDYARRVGKVIRTVDLTPERNVPVTFFN
jgi:cell division septal protein FtsQ